MENKKQLNVIEKKLDIIGEITAVQRPFKIRSLGNNCIIIGEDECCIVDPINNQRIKKICNVIERSCWEWAVHPNNKRVVFSHFNKATLYNVKKGQAEWSTVEAAYIQSVAFNPHDKDIFFCSRNQKSSITKYNYHTKERFDTVTDREYHSMTMHSKEKIICLADCEGDISLYEFKDNLGLSLTGGISLPIDIDYTSFCKYSPNDSCIIVGNDKKLFIIDLHDEGRVRKFLQCEKGESIKNIAINRNGTVLATLSKRIISIAQHDYEDLVLCYWDIKTRQLIAQLSGVGDASDGDFFRDGLEFLIALRNKCIRTAVPFEVLYQFFTKDELLYLLCVLNHIKDQGELTQDTVHYCMKNLLENCKR